MRMWPAVMCVLTGMIIGGCSRRQVPSPETQPASPPPASQAASAPQAVYKGMTARQWLDRMRAMDNDSLEWNDAAVETSEAFRELGPAAVPVVIEGMRDPKWNIREYCCFEIGKLGDAAVEGGAIEGLVEAMRDENFLVTESGEAGMGNLGMVSAKARARMIALLSSKDPFVRKKVALELGALGYTGREALPALEKLLKDPDPGVQENAREAIESIKLSM